eukprot:GHVS01027282.1.p1 GENE.GHVS01027282.1~~GHVS01027282.1.p1  ORF type:complete len:310 (+),score=24.14 GHVS01027282.1:70-930(+)
MNRHTLSIVAVVAALACLCQLHAHTVSMEENSISPSVPVTGSSPVLDVPDLFKNGDRNCKLFDYPPVDGFYFHGPPAPLEHAKLMAHINTCQMELDSGDCYLPIAHNIREHYGCDLRPFWRGSYTDDMPFNGPPVNRELRDVPDSTDEEVKPADMFPWSSEKERTHRCQLAEAAQGCILGDRLVACVKLRTIEDIEKKKNLIESEQVDKLLLDGYAAENQTSTMEELVEVDGQAQRWSKHMCKYLLAEGQCVRRIEDIGYVWLFGHRLVPSVENKSPCFRGESKLW